MPNLDQADVTAWLAEWRAGEDGWPPAVRAVECAADAPVRLAALGKSFDQAHEANIGLLSKSLHSQPALSDLRAVLAQLGAARALRLLHWISEADLPEGGSLLAGLLQADDKAGAALRAAVEGMRRKLVLARIFAPERLAALQAACTETLKETA
jgi:hypothetical protein